MSLIYKQKEPPKLINDNLPAKTYYRLGEAAEILGCTASAIIHYAATERLQILAPIPVGIFVYPKNFITGEINTSNFDNPCLFVLSTDSCRDIDLHGRASVGRFMFCYEMRGRFPLRCDPNWMEEDNEGLRHWAYVLSADVFTFDEPALMTIEIVPSDLIVLAEEIDRFKTSPEGRTVQQLTLIEGKNREVRSNSNRSDKLVLLNQVFMKYWANADRNDAQTHPKNAVVVSWLIEHGYTKVLAEKAATIIRPEWAATGRPQEK